ncbi:MAG TPA: hypothetical protein VD789_09705 [Thermomicrobiales bacterium]|nr:hypothetical protein [Thermomicrobiales bacterium]
MIQRRILAVILIVLLALPVLQGSAQTPEASAMPAENELPGLLASVWRSYAPEGTFQESDVIELDEATPLTTVAGTTQLRSIDVVVREFNSAENAASAFEQISTGSEVLAEGVVTDGSQEITSEDLPDIGSRASLVRLDHTGQGSTFWLEYVTVLRDQYVISVSATGSVWDAVPGSDEVDRSLPTVDIAAGMAQVGEPSPDEPVFMDDGTSTGGLWGFMPSADDPLLMGLVPSQDFVLFPIPGS